MTEKKIVLVAGKGAPTHIVFNAIEKEHGISLAIIEDKEDLKKFIKRRIKRLGIVTVAGQILFQVLVLKLLKRVSKNRYQQLLSEEQLNEVPIPSQKIKYVNSVNSAETIELLKTLNPDLIIVNGTRIISKKVLTAVNCPFINTHVGITPKYRGVHGAYWALVNNDAAHCGVTVHLVDEGIDTGNIIFQQNIDVTKQDNFYTYPLLQLAEGVKLLNKAIAAFYNQNLQSIKESEGESKIWYHPTAWQYLYNRLIKGVK